MVFLSDMLRQKQIDLLEDGISFELSLVDLNLVLDVNQLRLLKLTEDSTGFKPAGNILECKKLAETEGIYRMLEYVSLHDYVTREVILQVFPFFRGDNDV